MIGSELQKHAIRLRGFRWPLFAALCLIPFFGGCSGTPLTLGTLVEQLILGLILGSVYALIALGYTLVYGVIKLINFAHGDIYMLGAFGGYYMLRFTIRWLHFTEGISLIWCWIISVVVSSAACALIAVIMERFAYRPLRGSGRIAALITAVGVSFLLENLGIIVFSANPRSYEPKTLEVYQVQISQGIEDSQGGVDLFADPLVIERMDSAQIDFPQRKFKDTAFARVRLISQAGPSPWSPVLVIPSDEKGGYAELEGTPVGMEHPLPIESIGFSRRIEDGRKILRLNWTAADPRDTTLSGVFNDQAGEQRVIQLPLKTAQGVNVRVPVFNIVIVVVTLLLLWGLNQLINRSMFGISMRALSFDADAAKLMGVNVDKVIAQTFAIGGACAAVAGNMIGIYNQAIEPLMGILPGLKAFVAAVVGGIGSIPGAAVGGLIMGLSESLVKGNIASEWSALSDALAFAILIAVLLFKPSGIFGSAVKEKV